MQIENEFIIEVPVEAAWPILLDVQRIAHCLPGASVESVDGDAFAGRVKVKLGPVRLTYAGSGRFLERDEQARRAVIEAAGKDTNGSSTARALVTTTLAGAGDRTKVTVVTDFNVTGKPAQFGRGVMQDVSAKLVSQFAANLSAKLAADLARSAEDNASDVSALSAASPGAQALDVVDAAGSALIKRAAVPLAALTLLLVLRLVRRRA
jgi:carbon monoxide dehydrogenase subunit G